LARQFSKGLMAVQYPLIIPLPRVSLATVVNLHDVQHHDYPEHFSRAQLVWRRITYDDAARRSSLTLTLSQHARAKIIEHVGIEPDRVVAIGLAVDHARFRTEPAADEEERLAGLGLPKRFLFYPASLWPHKNHTRLIESLARVADRDIHLVLSGATFKRLAPLITAAEANGVGDRVHHLGFITEPALPAVYRRAIALVFPSTYEGFGTPPIEAMACGCPVASSRAASLAEVCGEAALELDPYDIDQMAAALNRVVGDRQVRSTLRERGLKQAKQFSWASVADSHMTAYRRAIEIGPQ
jgi:glycosyltransferase involved in cell wall biosynthesis